MTREEAILHMILRRKELKQSVGDLAEDVKAFDMAIKALEQEPCNDCIDRADAMTEIMMFAGNEKNNDDIYVKVSDVVQLLRELPSVQQEPKTDRLYRWLNDMRLGIAPDETTQEDERPERLAQIAVIDTIMEWLESEDKC